MKNNNVKLEYKKINSKKWFDIEIKGQYDDSGARTGDKIVFYIDNLWTVVADKISKELQANVLSGAGIIYKSLIDGSVKQITNTFDEYINMLQREYSHAGGLALLDRSFFVNIGKNTRELLPLAQKNNQYLVFNNIAYDLVAVSETKSVTPMKEEDIPVVENKIDFDLKSSLKDFDKKDLDKFKESERAIIQNLSKEDGQILLKRIYTSFGLSLLPKNYFKKMFVHISKPGAGKSTFFEMIFNLQRQFLTASWDPYIKDDFAKVNIINKQSIVIDETKTSNRIVQLEDLQKMITSQTVTTRVSGGKIYEWNRPNANFTLMTNFGVVADKNAGIWSRMIGIEWPNIIRGTKYESRNFDAFTENKKMLEIMLFKCISCALEIIVKDDLSLFDENVIEKMKNSDSFSIFVKAVKDKNSEMFSPAISIIEDKYTSNELFDLWRNFLESQNIKDREYNDIKKYEFKDKINLLVGDDMKCKRRSKPMYKDGTATIYYDFSKADEFPWEDPFKEDGNNGR